MDLSIALSNLEQAQGQLKQIQLSWIPLVNLYGGFSSNPGFGAPGTFYGAWPQYTLNIAKLIEQQKLANYNLEMIRALSNDLRTPGFKQTLRYKLNNHVSATDNSNHYNPRYKYPKPTPYNWGNEDKS